MMAIRYHRSYIDWQFEAKDIGELYNLVVSVGRDRELPDRFWLFARIYEWSCSTRSGVWQYYEHISAEDFEKTVCGLEQFKLLELAERYRSGMRVWKTPNGCDALDNWIDDHFSEIESIAFDLIINHRECLYDASKRRSG